MPLAPGTRLGPYEILAPVGAGGMGEVYKARDTRLERTVAVKVLPEHLSSSPESRQRFEREAKTISTLSDPHICALYDIGNQDGIEFLVMEYLEGETLADRLVRGPLPLDQTLRYGTQIADALDRAHRQGIVHRDLKPGNVMLTRSGVKLLDFGLAKLVAPPGASEVAGLSMLPTTPKGSNLTAQGTILGTFQYMAPEQLEGKEADARTDIFALGAVLYEMATGRKAFSGASQASLISSIMSSDPPPVSAIQPLAPLAIDRVVKTCLAKDPDERWQSASDVAKELRWIAEGAFSGTGLPAAVPSRRRRRELIAWSAAAAAGALALGLFFLRRPHTEGTPQRSFLLPPEKAEFETDNDHCASLTISPDGSKVTFAAKDADGKDMLWLRPLETLTARPIPGTEGAKFPFWSSDGNSLAFFAGGKLQRVDLAGGPPLVLCDAPNGRSGSWNHDGVLLFSPDTNTEIFQVPAAGGTPTPATKLEIAQNETTHRWATFLPDGRHFLYMAGSHSEGTKSASNAVYEAALGSFERTRIFPGRSNVAYAFGRLFFMREQVLLAQAFDPGRGRLIGDPTPLADGVAYNASYFRGDFSISESGALVYATGTGGTTARLRWFDLKTGQPSGDLFGDPAEYRQLALAPDESRIAATIADPSSGLPEIWLLDLRGARSRLTFGSPAFSPVFSPDGSRLAFARAPGVFVKPVSGNGAEELVYRSDAQVSPTDWSPDGRFLLLDVLQAGSKTKQDVWVLPLFGDRKAFPLLATDSIETGASFSADGRWITYMSDESGRMEVYATSFPGPGGKWQVSMNGSVGGAWLGPGRFVFGSLDGEAMLADVKEGAGGLQIGTPRPIFKVPPIDCNPANSRNGSRVLLAIHFANPETARVVLFTNWAAALRRP